MKAITLNNQCASIGYCQKLKDLGVNPIDTFFVYALGDKVQKVKIKRNLFKKEEEFKIICPAFTAGELGLLLPRSLDILWSSGADLMNGEHSVQFYCKSQKYDCIADTEADARAKQLIFLLDYEYYKLPTL